MCVIVIVFVRACVMIYVGHHIPLSDLESWQMTTSLYTFRASTNRFLMAKKTSIWLKTLKCMRTMSLTARKGPSWMNRA